MHASWALQPGHMEQALDLDGHWGHDSHKPVSVALNIASLSADQLGRPRARQRACIFRIEPLLAPST